MSIAAAATLSLPFAAPPPHLHRRSALSSSTSAFLTDSRIGLSAKMGGVRVSSRSRGRRGLQVSCLFGLGVPELVVIAGVAALVFGPKKLPEIGRSIGKTVKSFQQAAKEFETELKLTPDESDEPSAEKSISASENQKQENQKNLEATSQKESV